MNDLTTSQRRFNVHIMMLYISARDYARKLKFSSYVDLPSINKMFQYRYAWVILWGVGEVIIFEHGCYISALAHIRMLILSLAPTMRFLPCVSCVSTESILAQWKTYSGRQGTQRTQRTQGGTQRWRKDSDMFEFNCTDASKRKQLEPDSVPET